MATYQDLVAQKKELDALVESARKAEVSAAVAEVKRMVGEYGLSAVDCGFGAPAAKNAKTKVAVKFRGQNGESWTGRGKAPAWIVAHESAGHSRESLRAH